MPSRIKWGCVANCPFLRSVSETMLSWEISHRRMLNTLAVPFCSFGTVRFYGKNRSFRNQHPIISQRISIRSSTFITNFKTMRVSHLLSISTFMISSIYAFQNIGESPTPAEKPQNLPELPSRILKRQGACPGTNGIACRDGTVRCDYD